MLYRMVFYDFFGEKTLLYALDLVRCFVSKLATVQCSFEKL